MDFVFVLLCGSEWEDITILLSEEDASKNILLLLQYEKQEKRRPKCFREQKE